MNSVYFDPIRSYAIGDSFARRNQSGYFTKNKKSYFLNSIISSIQLSSLSSLLTQYSALSPSNTITRTIQLFVGFTPKLSKIVLATGLITHYVNSPSPTTTPLSSSRLHRLKNRAIQTLTFASANLHRVSYVAYVVTTIALVTLSPMTAVPLLSALTYHALDQKKLIPEKISRFMEDYGYVLNSTILLFDQSILIKLLALSSLATIFNRKSQLVYSWVDKVITPKSIPTLVQVDNKSKFNVFNLSVKQVMRTLNNPRLLRVNPTMAARNFREFTKIEPNSQYNAFMTLLDGIDSNQNSFVDYFKSKPEWITACRAEMSFQAEMTQSERDQLAETNIQSEEYLKGYVKGKLQNFLQIVKGEVTVEGSQKQTLKAIKNCQFILAYLQRYQSEDGGALLLRTLSTLAMEAKGSSEMISSLTRLTRNSLYKTELNSEQTTRNSDYDCYELNLLRKLEVVRAKMYKDSLEEIGITSIPSLIRSNYEVGVGLGFHPLSKEERKSIGFTKILIKLLLNEFPRFSELYHTEALKCISEMDKQQTHAKIRQIINDSDMSQDSKTAKLLEYDTIPVVAEEAKRHQDKFNRLILVKMGVLTAD